MAELERINLVVTGHVDHGKSTSLGHLLFLLGQVHDPKRNREPWRILQQYFVGARNEGMASWSYAWVLDPLIEERKRGLTINISHTEFRSNKYIFNLIDAPGHSDFVKNMITGASQADAAILMVSARKGEFEDGLKSTGTGSGKYQNVIGMTLEHMLLLSALGITDVVVGINKMDAVNWDQARYEEIKKKVGGTFLTLLKAMNVENAEEKAKNIKFVPMSGLLGINLLPKDMTIKNLQNHIEAAKAGKGDAEFIKALEDELKTVQEQWPDWYDGPSLLEALDMLPSPAEKQKTLMAKPLRIPIQSVLNISGVGTVLTGRVASGVLKPDMTVVVSPTKKGLQPIEVTVKSIQEFHKDIPQAIPGDNIGFNIKAKNLGAKDILKGAVVSSPDDPVAALEPEVDAFQGFVLVIRSLSKAKKGKGKAWSFHVGYTPVLHIGTAQVACRVTEIRSLDGKELGELKQNQRGMVWFTPTQPICVEELSRTPQLGRFAIRDSGKTVAVGIVDKVERGRYKK